MYLCSLVSSIIELSFFPLAFPMVLVVLVMVGYGNDIIVADKLLSSRQDLPNRLVLTAKDVHRLVAQLVSGQHVPEAEVEDGWFVCTFSGAMQFFAFGEGAFCWMECELESKLHGA